jgi:type II restriction enzyme
MIDAITGNKRPNLLVMQYDNDWSVRNLLLVPSFFFSREIIEKRKPLGANARRRNWVGCNILLKLIPPAGRIQIVQDGHAVERDSGQCPMRS